MHFLLFYEVVEDYVARRQEFRDQHLAAAWQFHRRGELLLGGALADPIDGAVLLFEGDSEEVAHRFVAIDPYVQNGLVKSWRVRKWHTVVGEQASAPMGGTPDTGQTS